MNHGRQPTPDLGPPYPLEHDMDRVEVDGQGGGDLRFGGNEGELSLLPEKHVAEVLDGLHCQSLNDCAVADLLRMNEGRHEHDSRGTMLRERRFDLLLTAEPEVDQVRAVGLT